MPHDQQKIVFNYHLDREILDASDNDAPDWLVAEMQRRELVLGSNSSRASFCGIILKGADLRVFFPRKTRIVEYGLDVFDKTVLLVNCIERYAREVKTAVVEGSGQDTSLNINSLALVKNILKDYQQNGNYVNRVSRKVVNSGKANWRRTLRHGVAQITSRGEPIYLKIYGDRSSSESTGRVADIHRAVIQEMDIEFGWWVTGKPDGRVDSNIRADKNILLDRAYCIQVLEAELNEAYSDRNVYLLSNLVRYLKNNDSPDDGAVVIGIKEFHWVWERMLSSMLAYTIELSDALPSPTYSSQDGAEYSATNNKMRPDCIISNPGRSKIVVVDAKYYDAISSRSAPPWGDIVKQLFYAKAIKKIFPNAKIGSVFMFPGMEGSEVRFSELRMKSLMDEVSFDDEFPPIVCLYLSPLEAMSYYADRSVSVEFSADVLDSATKSQEPLSREGKLI